MLRDFAKLNTFLAVIKEKSFSKASAKLGISQPAVTQQIKFIEDYLDCKIVERKKNGIKLTKEGEDLYRIVLKLEKSIANSEKELLKVMNKEFTFIIGTSAVIGNYIIPTHLSKIKQKIENEVHVNIGPSEDVIEQLEDKKIDIALIESPIFHENITYREWVEDELVLFSKEKLPRTLTPEELYDYDWICRNENSHTRRLTAEVFEEIGVACTSFNVLGVVSSATSIKETILHTDNENGRPVVSIISRHVISDELQAGILHESKIRDYTIKRKFYIAYLKDRKLDAYVDNVVNYLLSLNRV
ncbi:MAG: LysR family transcriptional regulator [Campylobacterota bacterium]|nr:LysR family transcriptional regulator [Campylobacterota bacterium]